MIRFSLFVSGSILASLLFLFLRDPAGGWPSSAPVACKHNLSRAQLLSGFSGGLLTVLLHGKYSGGQLVLNAVLYGTLFAMAVFDFHHLILPDSLQAVFLLVALFDPGSLHSYSGGAAMLALTAGCSFLVVDGLGGGDIKLLVICGFYLGMTRSSWLLFLAALAALVVLCFKKEAQQQAQIPFGPYLIAAFFVVRELF